ncbi:hypothetical protein DLJ49_13075 [Rhodovulum sp. 12E13]|uniref:hypothetical protein n=1 Tax=Rhodovulum sp. 12E13 TaxID=2203891 RepID=UPI000E19288F|nr:hypothetical protein [Rhodovulum sp. 12E13]RDC71786.1 hypothetical protein DLJ49_13075 [Rhodovulum sp. 12E13]
MRRLAALLLVCALAAPAPAMQLTLRDSFAFPRPASMEWDPVLCGLWVAVDGPQVFLLTPAGRVIRDIAPGMRVIRSLTVEEDGLLLVDGWGGVQRVTREGETRGAPFRLHPDLRDVEGITRDASGDFLLVQDDVSRLFRVSPEGAIRQMREGAAYEPALHEMQGIARDPLTGNLLVVDDNEGLNALVELTPDGAEVISVTPLSEWGHDAEGVAVHAQTGTLYIGFEAGRRIALFDYLPTRPEAGPEAFDQGPDCAFS